MRQDDFRKRINKLLAEERKNPLEWWYLSYATENGFLGAVYIEAHGQTEAAYLSNRRGHSPGGEVFIIGPVPREHIPPPSFCNRLLNKAEIQEANPGDKCGSIAEFEAEEENDGTKR